MENTQIIAERIKEQAKNENKSVKSVLEECELSKNLVNKLASGSDIGTQSLKKIADYLNCSVDYLLGREQKNAPIEIENWSELSKELGSLTETEVDEFITIAKYVKSQRQKK